MDDLTDPMPERIWAYHYTPFPGTGYPLWRSDRRPENNGDCAGITPYLRSRPVLEHAEEMRKLLGKNDCSSFPDSCHACGDIECLTRDAQELLATIEREEREAGK